MRVVLWGKRSVEERTRGGKDERGLVSNEIMLLANMVKLRTKLS